MFETHYLFLVPVIVDYILLLINVHFATQFTFYLNFFGGERHFLYMQYGFQISFLSVILMRPFFVFEL